MQFFIICLVSCRKLRVSRRQLVVRLAITCSISYPVLEAFRSSLYSVFVLLFKTSDVLLRNVTTVSYTHLTLPTKRIV